MDEIHGSMLQRIRLENVWSLVQYQHPAPLMFAVPSYDVWVLYKVELAKGLTKSQSMRPCGQSGPH